MRGARFTNSGQSALLPWQPHCTHAVLLRDCASRARAARGSRPIANKHTDTAIGPGIVGRRQKRSTTGLACGAPRKCGATMMSTWAASVAGLATHVQLRHHVDDHTRDEEDNHWEEHCQILQMKEDRERQDSSWLLSALFSLRVGRRTTLLAHARRRR